jgi:hypothetical protein
MQVERSHDRYGPALELVRQASASELVVDVAAADHPYMGPWPDLIHLCVKKHVLVAARVSSY